MEVTEEGSRPDQAGVKNGTFWPVVLSLNTTFTFCPIFSLERSVSTMPDMIRAHAKDRPNHRAIIDGDRVLTFAEFDALIDRAAAAMQRDGLGNKGAVAICGPSSIEYVTTFVAALGIGAAACPLAPSSTDEQLAAMVRDCGAGLLFVDDSASTTIDGVAEKLTVKNAAGQVTRYGYAQGFSEQQADPHMMIPYLLGEGEQLFKPDGKANFASPAGIAGMTFATDLIKKYQVSPPQSATWTVDDLFEQFSSDRVAMIQGPSVRVSSLQAKLGKENVGQMLWPGNGKTAHSPAVMAGWAVGVWSKGQQKEEAGKFVDYLLGAESEKIWVTVGGQSPLMASTAKAVASFVDQPGNGYIRVAGEGASKYGWLTPIEFNVGGYRQALNKATQRIIVDGVAVKTALEEAEARFNRQNNR